MDSEVSIPERVSSLLLVEDDAGHVELIVRAFTKHNAGAQVRVAQSLRVAREMVSDALPDLAIVDFLLPDGRGIELLSSQHEDARYPVVILTAHGDEREAVEALKAGALNYVLKSEATFREVPHVADAALREWRHLEQRLHAENALRESEARFRNLIEGSIQGIMIARGWKALFANQAFADILGYDSPEQILSLDSTRQIFAPYEQGRLWEYHQARLSEGAAPTHYEFDAIRKDDSVVSLQNVVRLVSWGGEPAVQSVVIDISDRKRAEAALQYRAQLEELITGMSARFINLTSREIDEGIDEALREIGTFADVDRSYVTLFSENFSRLSNRFEWCRDGVKALIDQTQDMPVELLPWVAEKHKSGQIVYVPRLDHLPEQATVDKERFNQLGIKSLISIPLVNKGVVLGYLGFDSVHEEKQWTEDIISLLTIVGESLANALDRKVAEDALRTSEERFKDFADIAADWFWEMGPDLRFIYLSERYQQVIGVTPETHLGMTPEEIFKDHVGDVDVWRKYLDNMGNERPFSEELSWVRVDGASRVVRHIGRPRYADDGSFLGYRGVGRDVTEAYRMTAQIAHQASHDALTGLVNRREFERRLERAVKNAHENAVQYVLGYIDLDRFKIVNDVAGHAVGDVLLKRVAAMLNARIRGRDTLARLGGDEFSLLLENCPLEKALQITDSMLEETGSFRFPWEGRSFEIGLSIGLISINVHAESATRALAQADMACYTAKRLGRNRVHVYRMEDSELAKRQSDIRRISDIRDALDKDQFRLYGQPIIPLSPHLDGPVHYEMLIRLIDEEGEIVMPDVFIPTAERYGLMAPIDRWVIKTAFRYSHSQLGEATSPGIAINLSGNSLNDDSLLDFVTREFELSGMSPDRVCFEITETAAINNFDKTADFITALKAVGCSFALDDFGSGVSSFNYLKHLPVDYLKIDGSFVRDMAVEPVDRAMVAAIHQVSRIMGIQTIAECADTDAVIGQLRELGVDYVQGDAIGTAIPLEQVGTHSFH